MMIAMSHQFAIENGPVKIVNFPTEKWCICPVRYVAIFIPEGKISGNNNHLEISPAYSKSYVKYSYPLEISGIELV